MHGQVRNRASEIWIQSHARPSPSKLSPLLHVSDATCMRPPFTWEKPTLPYLHIFAVACWSFLYCRSSSSTDTCKILWDTPAAVNSPSTVRWKKVLSAPSSIFLNLNPINSKWPGSYKIRCDLIRFRSQLRVQSLMPSWSLACITPQNLSIKDDWIYYNTLKFASMKIELKLFNFAFLCS